MVLFCIGFAFFYAFPYGRAKAKQRALPSAPLGRVLPEVKLVDSSGAQLTNEELRHGRVVLVVVTPDCSSCLEESQFLSTVVDMRKDVRFYGVLPFAAEKDALKSAEGKFPFRVFLDQGFTLSDALTIREVPIKIFLEDGIVKKTWIGSTTFYKAEGDFKDWLTSLD